MELRLLSLVFFLVSFTIAEDFGECYWPSGKRAPANWIKCPGQTNCCASGESCLSNSLCYQAHMNLAYRGACSDRDWPSSSCPHICYDQLQDGWANIFPCANNTNEQFTCGGPGGWVPEVCDADLQKFVWDTNQMYKVTYAQLPEPGANSSSASASATAAPSSSSSSISSQSAGACTPVSEEDHAHEKTALAAGLGVGLGVPLALVSAAFIAFWLRTRKQLQEARSTIQAYANAQNSAPMAHGMMPAPAYNQMTELSGKGTPFAGELDGSEMRAREMEG